MAAELGEAGCEAVGTGEGPCAGASKNVYDDGPGLKDPAGAPVGGFFDICAAACAASGAARRPGAGAGGRMESGHLQRQQL